MSKPRILVLTATGKTGLPVCLQLLGEGFRVTAFVHKEDGRSAVLKSKGANIIAGSITDINDMRKAMEGVQRAYFCVPAEEGNLKAAAVFTAVAAEQKLESIVVMSQWLASPTHPSLHTREVWYADHLIALLPGTAVTTINVGFFADNDMQPLAFAAHFGRLMLPYGIGRNAAPSNEDIAAVIAEILARPAGHAGKIYRPTGPELLSGKDMAAILSKVLDRKVQYVDAPLWTVRKIMRGFGFSDYLIAQSCEYYREYQQDTFAISAPTEVVRSITGREPENFETIARRYLALMPDTRRSFGISLKLMMKLPLWMLRPDPKTAHYLATGDFSDPEHINLDSHSAEWRSSHENQGEPVGQEPADYGNLALSASKSKP